MRQKSDRYGALLKYREFLEENMKSELAEVLQALDLEERKLFAMEEIFRQAKEELMERQEKAAPPHEIFMYHSYLQQISHDMEIQRKRVNEATKTYNERKAATISASKDKSIVEKVRDKQLECLKEEVKKNDKKAMNEICSNRFIRHN